MKLFNAQTKTKVLRLSKDFMLSILASIIYTFARQIVVFPLLASRLSDAEYGTLLTVIGLVNVCTAMIGNTLNNVRLIQNEEYRNEGVSGDFLLLCVVGNVVTLLFSVALWHMFRYSLLTAILLTAFMLVSNLYLYGSAYFRIELDYKKNLIANIVVALSYVFSAFFFANPTFWPVVFLSGELAGFVYTAISTHFLGEPLKKTPLLDASAKKWTVLILTGLVGNLLTYADRMLLHPILGPEAVSYYTTASFFGKSAGIIMTPIAGVLLGYYSQKDFKASKKLFVVVNGASLACLSFFLLGCWLFAPWFTKLLYPTLFEASAPYIMLANLGAVISIAVNMANPMILKCCSTRWIFALSVLHGTVYLASALYLLPLYGLLGFCWATILANSVRLLATYALGFWKL